MKMVGVELEMQIVEVVVSASLRRGRPALPGRRRRRSSPAVPRRRLGGRVGYPSRGTSSSSSETNNSMCHPSLAETIHGRHCRPREIHDGARSSGGCPSPPRRRTCPRPLRHRLGRPCWASPPTAMRREAGPRRDRRQWPPQHRPPKPMRWGWNSAGRDWPSGPPAPRRRRRSSRV